MQRLRKKTSHAIAYLMIAMGLVQFVSYSLLGTIIDVSVRIRKAIIFITMS